jgi:peptidoglycan/xylan/chitin deacetylase (PgdA/CDA1 family)
LLPGMNTQIFNDFYHLHTENLKIDLIDKFNYKWNCFWRDAGWYVNRDRSRLTHAKGARILVYHGICLDDHLRFNTLFVKLRTFESHLKFYKKYYNVISLDDYYQQRFSDTKLNLCLTFDDGFANNHKYVLPLLQQYQIPATFFITGIREAGYDILWNDLLSITGRFGPQQLVYKNDQYKKNRFRKYISVSNGRPLGDLLRSSDFTEKKKIMQQLSSLVDFKNISREEDYWLQMTKEQVGELSSSPLVSIGAHGFYHNDLSQISIDQAKDEMIRCKKYLEIVTGKEIKALAFPYGSYTEEIKEEAKKIGFSQLLATRFLFQKDVEDATMRERLTINPFISVINQMHANIAGHYR